MKAAIISPTIINKDAVGNDIIGMCNFFKKRNIDVCMFCDLNTTNNKHLPITYLQDWIKPEDIAIYHQSIGWRNGLNTFLSVNCKKVIKHHNVTPPHFFNDDNRLRLTTQGIEETEELFKLNCLQVSDSLFNTNNNKCEILPPFHNTDELLTLDSDIHCISDWKNNILMVGRIVKNKNHETAISIFSHYKKKDKYSKLILVGRYDCSTYREKLNNIITNSNLQNDVIFTDSVSPETLKTLYQTSELFLTTSLHEGFCVPLIESMAFGLPILANNICAIPETCGDVAEFIENNPHENVADQIYNIIHNPQKSYQMRLKGRERYKNNFTNNILENKFEQIIKSFF